MAASASARRSGGAMKGERWLSVAAIVIASSAQPKMAPSRMSFPGYPPGGRKGAAQFQAEFLWTWQTTARTAVLGPAPTGPAASNAPSLQSTGRLERCVPRGVRVSAPVPASTTRA